MALFLSLGLGYGLIRTAFNLNDSGTGGRTLTAGLVNGLLEESILNPEECSSGEYSRWTGTEWICSADRSGGERGPQGIQGPPGPAGGGFFGSGTNYYAGEGLRLSGNTFSLDDLEDCSSGEYSRWTGSSWGCFDDRTSGGGSGGGGDDVDAGDGLRFDGDALEIDSPSCSSDQFSRWTGSHWVCGTDRTSGGTGGGGSFYYAGTGLRLDGDTFSLNIQSCPSGSFNRWTGSSWTCETDRTGGGTGGTVGISSINNMSGPNINISAGNGISISNSNNNVTITATGGGAGGTGAGTTVGYDNGPSTNAIQGSLGAFSSQLQRGSSGDAFWLRCPAGQVLTGIYLSDSDEGTGRKWRVGGAECASLETK